MGMRRALNICRRKKDVWQGTGECMTQGGERASRDRKQIAEFYGMLRIALEFCDG